MLFVGMASSNSSSVSNPAPRINWAMIRANKDENERMKFQGSVTLLYKFIVVLLKLSVC